MKNNTISNPFSECTARDMTYEEVQKYWCNPFGLYKLNEEELFSSKTPIVIEGARGTGKTMLLKHLAYYSQKDALQGKSIEEKLKALEKTGVGIYYRYKEDFCNLCFDLNCDEKDKRNIFVSYYELYICRQILEILGDIYADKGLSPMMRAALGNWCGVVSLDADAALENVNQKIWEIDNQINMSAYESGWENAVAGIVNGNNLVNRLIRTITNNFPGWERIQFNILLDEYENVKQYQGIINTLLKQVDDTVNVSYRVGMRPGGMINNKTYVAGECLQIDRDFILHPLTCSKFDEYKKFAFLIAEKRLKSVDLFQMHGITDIEKVLGAKEDLDAEAKAIVKDTRQFQMLKGKFPDEKEFQDMVCKLSCDEKLMEMYNVLRVYRGQNYHVIAKACAEYQKAREKKQLKNAEGELKKYYLDYSNKYRMALLYILLTIYKKKKAYYSVNTFLRLSSGAINDFISLCRNTFYYVDDEVILELKKGNPINKQLQTEAALKTAQEQLRKVGMSNRFGKEMCFFIGNLGGIFECYHKDLEARYPETNQFAFENENSIYSDEKLNAYVTELINSGAIIKVEAKSHISVGKPRGNVFKLNRIFAPMYQFSYRTRGGYNHIISRDEFEKMLNESIIPQKYIGGHTDVNQYSIYDYMEIAEDE